MKQGIIINADDLGISKEVNNAIRQLFIHQCISSATLIVTSPAIDDIDVEFFGEQARNGKIGLHIDLREFRPLSDALYSTEICNEQGFFVDIRKSGIPFVKKLLLLNNIRREVEHQIAAFERIMGCKPSHLDSHGHTHTHPLVFLAILLSKKVRSIGKMRRAREYVLEDEQTRNLFKNTGKTIFNGVLSFVFTTTDLFIGIRRTTDRSLLQNKDLDSIQPPKTIEIMCHPSTKAGTEQYDEYVWLQSNPYACQKNHSFVNYTELD